MKYQFQTKRRGILPSDEVKEKRQKYTPKKRDKTSNAKNNEKNSILPATNDQIANNQSSDNQATNNQSTSRIQITNNDTITTSFSNQFNVATTEIQML